MARKRSRKPVALSSAESDRLTNRLFRIVCSSAWEQHCKSLILSGDVTYKHDQAKELRRTAVYPPGGLITKMCRCEDCRRWIPPQAIGSNGVCVDCYYESLPLAFVSQIPSSPDFKRRFKTNDAIALMERSGGTRRRRILGDDGYVHEQREDENGFLADVAVYEITYASMEVNSPDSFHVPIMQGA